MSSLNLQRVVESLRCELAEMMRQREVKGPRFTVERAEVELSIEVSTEGGANGEVKFSVLGTGVSVGGSGKASESSIHKLKLTLLPLEKTIISDAKGYDPTAR